MPSLDSGHNLPDSRFSPFLRQIHAHPSRRQPDSLLLIHAHSRIVPFEKGSVHALSPRVLDVLLRGLNIEGGSSV